MNNLSDAVHAGQQTQDDEIEVGLASPGRRIAAALLNVVLNFLVFIPFVIWILSVDSDYAQRAQGLDGAALSQTANTGGMIVVAMLVVFMVYGVIQLYFMSRDGQSLGKKIMGIRVLKTDGSNPGFFGTVFMREMLFSLILIGVMLVLAVILGIAVIEQLSNVVQLIYGVANVVMLFLVKNDRRTIPDYLANTVVVRLPKK